MLRQLDEVRHSSSRRSRRLGSEHLEILQDCVLVPGFLVQDNQSIAPYRSTDLPMDDVRVEPKRKHRAAHLIRICDSEEGTLRSVANISPRTKVATVIAIAPARKSAATKRTRNCWLSRSVSVRKPGPWWTMVVDWSPAKFAFRTREVPSGGILKRSEPGGLATGVAVTSNPGRWSSTSTSGYMCSDKELLPAIYPGDRLSKQALFNLDYEMRSKSIKVLVNFWTARFRG